MDESGLRDTGRLAIGTGVVAVGSLASLGCYFAVQGPFGTVNDIGNAATGVLSAWLAWRLRDQVRRELAPLAVGAAFAGATLTVLGSAMVMSASTGFLSAGLVSNVGFAGIGAWLVIATSGVRPDRARRWLGWTGRLAGAVMAAGVLSAPAIVLVDDLTAPPAWAWLGFAGWLGTYVLYPAWAIRYGMRARAPRAGDRAILADSPETA